MKLNINIIASVFCFGVIAVISYMTFLRPHPQINYFATETLAADQIVPTVSQLPPHEEMSTQPSPDGTKKLVMRVTPASSDANTYTFTTMDSTGENKKEIYTATLSGDKFTIPFNTWSPDNKYLFVQKDSGEALVFARSGEAITPVEQFIDVKDIFSKKDRQDRYSRVTGWASPTLLIINTVGGDGAKGSSYWFEVPSKAIIELWGDF